MRPRKTESERKSERERCGQLPRTVQESQMKANSVAINLKDSERWCKISTVGAQSELTFLIEASVCVFECVFGDLLHLRRYVSPALYFLNMPPCISVCVNIHLSMHWCMCASQAQIKSCTHTPTPTLGLRDARGRSRSDPVVSLACALTPVPLSLVRL